MPFYRDQRTDTVSGCTGCGIFTTTTGTAPNRVFRVEYRTTYFGETSATPTLDYEVNLYENGSPAFDYTYGLINGTTTTGRITSIGVQKNTTLFTQYACDTTGQTPPVATGQKLTASARIVRIAHAYRNAYRNSYSVGYAQLHARLVCGCAAPDAWRPRSWRLFPGQWEVLCHGRTQC
jgi:hypothetical protein